MKLISTRTHGVLDLATAATMVALPRLMGWSDMVTRTLTTLGGGALGYSLLTRYEFGLWKVLPMPAHLALDAVSGVTLCASPWLLPDEDPEVISVLVGMGVFELAAAALTETQPRLNEEGIDSLKASGRWAQTDAGYADELRRSSTSAML